MRRLSDRGRVDHRHGFAFTFDGRDVHALQGDTVASALLANSIDVLGSSVLMSRPRGVVADWVSDPHAFAQVGADDASEPLVRATQQEAHPGLVVESRLHRGVLPTGADPDRFEKRHAHCDVLVVGGGPAGLSAALAAADAGARVMLVDDHEAEVVEVHRLLQQRVRAHHDSGVAADDVEQRSAVPFFTSCTGVLHCGHARISSSSASTGIRPPLRSWHYSILLESRVPMRPVRVALFVGATLLTGPASWVFAQTATDAYYPFLIARHLEAEGDSQGAQQELERAVAADPRSAEVRAELAGFFLRRENWDGADRVAREALAIETKVAAALAYAHRNGVVHRDLTLGNVFLCDDGQVKLLDLGIAQAFGFRRLEGGTPDYMAPEQAAGAPQDERVDVFSLGVILHRMLTGRDPFDGARPKDSPSRRKLLLCQPHPGVAGSDTACARRVLGRLADDVREFGHAGSRLLKRRSLRLGTRRQVELAAGGFARAEAGHRHPDQPQSHA